jgi:GntR family negative regulator for fad regulon and positive regulator of fabA
VPDPKESANDRAERLLIERILDGTYPPGADLPGERALSDEFGVARPALREALQRLSRDGWLDIHHGKSTRVVDLMRGGTLSILSGLVKADSRVWQLRPRRAGDVSLIAPAYTARAVERSPWSQTS